MTSLKYFLNDYQNGFREPKNIYKGEFAILISGITKLIFFPRCLYDKYLK